MSVTDVTENYKEKMPNKTIQQHIEEMEEREYILKEISKVSLDKLRQLVHLLSLNQ